MITSVVVFFFCLSICYECTSYCIFLLMITVPNIHLKYLNAFILSEILCSHYIFFAITANYAAFGESEHFLLHTEPRTLLWMCLQNCVLCELQLCAMCMLCWPESLCKQVWLTVYFFFYIPALQSKEPHHLKTIFILKSHVTLDAYMDNHKHQKWFIFFPLLSSVEQHSSESKHSSAESADHVSSAARLRKKRYRR